MDKDLNIFQNAEVDLKVNGGPTNIGAFLGSYDKVILKPNKKGSKNVLEQWMLSAPHTKYVIKYDFTLEDTIIEMPNDAILEIDCGSLQHGTLVGKSTGLINTNKVDNALVDITLDGTWNTQTVPDKPAGDGMGKVYLKQGVPLSEQMTKENTIYVIQYDFELDENITIPVNCVLEFDGGSVSGAYTITGDNTGIKAGLIKIFNIDVTLAGSWNVAEAYPEWFGAKKDKEDNVSELQKVFDSFRCVVLSNMYKISNTLIVNRELSIIGADNSRKFLYIDFADKPIPNVPGIMVTSRLTAIDLKESFYCKNIIIAGYINDFISNSIPTYPKFYGIKQYSVLKTFSIEGCSIVGFSVGIYSEGSSIRTISACCFSACGFGIKTNYTSDFEIINCTFSSCLNNISPDGYDIQNIRNVGGGLLLENAAMVQVLNNRFEWNFCNISLVNKAIDIIISNNIFDRGVISNIDIYNVDRDDSEPIINGYSFKCLDINNNTFVNGVGLNNIKGKGHFTITNGAFAGRRSLELKISNNFIDDLKDNIGLNIGYEETLFRILNSTSDINASKIYSTHNIVNAANNMPIAMIQNGSAGRITMVDADSEFININHEFWHNIFDIKKYTIDGTTMTIWNTLSDGSVVSQDTIIQLQ